jgi:hypothetical protein
MTKTKKPKQATSHSPTDEVIEVINKLTKNQQHVLGLIAIGLDGAHHPKTLEALLKKQLIDFEEITLKDKLGKLTIKRYYVPLFIHYAWCQWCAENCKSEDEQEL